MRLKVGDKFKQAFQNNSGLVFEILELDMMKDLGKIKCTNRQGHSWTEDWDDMHTVVWALELGDYIMIK